MRLMIRMTLRAMAEIEVTGEAVSAEQAIDEARRCAPALIVLDNSLEGAMTGLQAASLLREAAPDAKILLFSAFDLAAEAEAEAAIDQFLRKDSVRDLSTTVRQMLKDRNDR